MANRVLLLLAMASRNNPSSSKILGETAGLMSDFCDESIYFCFLFLEFRMSMLFQVTS